MSYALIEESKDGRVAYITLNRPEKRNALSFELVGELKDVLGKLADDDSRAIVIKANGKVFSAGADLAFLEQLQHNSYEDNLADSNHLKELFDIIYHHPKPIIAQIQGHAIAGGCGLATVCDFSFSVEEAKFGYTEVAIGFVPAIVMVFLIRKIGEAKARELLLTGKIITSQKAQEMGLINEVVNAEKLDEHVREFVDQLVASTSGSSIAMTKRLMADVQGLTTQQAIDLAAKVNAEARASDDCKKGINAFLNKEKITW